MPGLRPSACCLFLFLDRCLPRPFGVPFKSGPHRAAATHGENRSIIVNNRLKRGRRRTPAARGAERQEVLGNLCHDDAPARRPAGDKPSAATAVLAWQAMHRLGDVDRNRRGSLRMDSPSSVALSGQMARERQMDVLANNIANLSTVGFKGEQMIVLRAPDRNPRAARQTAYVEDSGTVRDWSEGPLTRTGNSLDVALQGAGFPRGRDRERHALHARRPAQARCPGPARHARRRPVLNEARAAHRGAAGTARSITIGPGRHASRRAGGTIGHLAVVDFADRQNLVAEADGRFQTDQTPAPVPPPM